MSAEIDSVIDKIKKAVRLARRTTSEGERDTALRLARNLAEKNGIAFDDLAVGDSDAKAVMKDDTETRRYEGTEIGHACFILHEHFGVCVMFNRHTNGRAFVSWFGTAINIELAKHVFHILLRESRRAWNKARADMVAQDITTARTVADVCGGSWRQASALVVSKIRRKQYNRCAFMTGFFWAIHQKLAANPIRNDIEQFKAEKAAAERKLEEFKSKNEVGESKHRKSKTDARSLERGLAFGQRVNLSRPCEGHAEERVAIAM